MNGITLGPPKFVTAEQAYLQLSEYALYCGKSRVARDQPILEIGPIMFIVKDAGARTFVNKTRGLRKGYSAASVAWNLAERNDVEGICWWNENGRRISDDGETFHGANYGQRLMPYLEECITLLGQDEGTRRAYAPVWRPDDLVSDFSIYAEHDIGKTLDKAHYSREGKDVPCTLGFGLNIEDGRLNLDVVMRSQALHGVFPYDFYFASALQELVANELGTKVGHISWTALSLHLYERELDHVKAVIKDGEYAICAHPEERLKITLDDARELYPRMLNLCMDERVSISLEINETGDPVVNEMILGAIEKRGSE